MKINKQTILIIIATVPLLWNLIKPGFYTSHDGEWMAIRLTAFHQGLRQGQFPVRWTSRLNHGYGYPVLNFLYPMPFYLAEPLYLFTHNPATAIQVIMGLSIISLSTGMFFLLKKWGNWPAIVGTLTFTYAPYLAFNLYQRGSLGEIVALGIVPWIFWSINKKKFYFTALLIAGLITSHNVAAAIFFPVIIVFLAVQCFKTLNSNRKKLKLLITNYLLLITLALGASAFFWIPALLELKYVRASQFAISDFENEYLSFRSALQRSGILTALFNGGLPLFFLTHKSLWFWQAIPRLQIIQFPWRLLSLFSFSGGVIAAITVSKLQSRRLLAIIIGSLVIALSIYSSLKYLVPSSIINQPPQYYQTNDDTTTSRAEYTPIWVTDLPNSHPNPQQYHYYPGLKVFADGQLIALPPPQQTNGLITIPSEHSDKEIKIVFSETPLRVASNLISVISVLFIIAWWQKSRKVQLSK